MYNTPEDIIESLTWVNPDAILYDGFDDALVGTAHRYGMEAVAVYDYDLMISVLMGDDMDYGDAVEYIDYNIFGFYVGEHMPIVMLK